MACFRPLKAYYKPGGGICFDAKNGYQDRRLELNCGKCAGCREKKAREWAVRICHEALMHTRKIKVDGAIADVPNNCFITLTFRPQELPENGSVCKRDLQLFFKRLRKKIGPFRYFACGEYGEEDQRPHYHAILFGHDFHADKVYFKKGTKGFPIYVSKTLTDVWGKGFTTVQDVGFESARYVARYGAKSSKSPGAFDDPKGRAREFIVMSRGGRNGPGGIGLSWIREFGRSDVFPHDDCVVEGRKVSPPRYYDNQLDDEELKIVKAERRRRVDLSEFTPERLKSREKVLEARLSLRPKNKIDI